MADRVLYASFGHLVLFCLDRVQYAMETVPVPKVLNVWGLFLYLAHPLLLVLFIAAGIHDVLTLWFAVLVVALLGAATASMALGRVSC